MRDSQFDELVFHERYTYKILLFVTNRASSFTCTRRYTSVGRDSLVGVATRYGLDGRRIGSRWGRDFPHPSIPAQGPTQPPVEWVPDLPRG